MHILMTHIYIYIYIYIHTCIYTNSVLGWGALNVAARLARGLLGVGIGLRRRSRGRGVLVQQVLLH